MSGLPWFRMYTEFATDPLIRMLSFEDRAHFVMALCLKANGTLDKEYASPEVKRAVLSQLFGLSGRGENNALDAANERVRALGLVDIDWHPLNWEKRQFKSDSSDPTAADRMQRYRDRKRNDTVTLRNVTPLESESESESDSNTEHMQSAPASRETERSASRSTACRLPDDFALTEEMTAYAKGQQCDPARTFEAFGDYWRAASGAKARKHDWIATWRTWCRTEADRRGNFKPNQGTFKPSHDAQWSEAKARARAIGFREPYPTESANVYATAVKFAETAKPMVPLSERRGLAGIKRIGA